MLINIFTKYKDVILLGVIVFSLVSYNFISAQWVGPTGNPTTGNVATPINVSTSAQTKYGDLVVNNLAAVLEVWSDKYCDALGQNCISQSRFIHSLGTYAKKLSVANVSNGQTATLRCDDTDTDYSAMDFLMGGGCRVTSTYNELLNKGDVFSYPTISISAEATAWNCENKNLATSTIEVSIICQHVAYYTNGGI